MLQTGTAGRHPGAGLKGLPNISRNNIEMYLPKEYSFAV